MRTSNKSNVLLTELIIVILFFSLIAVTITQMFVGAHQKSKANASIERAWILAQDCVEMLSGQEDPAGFLLDVGYEQFEDAVYQRVSGSGEFLIQAHFQPEEASKAGRLLSAEVTVCAAPGTGEAAADPETLVALPWLSYIPLGEVIP